MIEILTNGSGFTKVGLCFTNTQSCIARSEAKSRQVASEIITNLIDGEKAQ
uniref:Uncharacterized protein n=1 Tax=Candidatus Kentrum sp. TC TaxID=2126339 RepID=A0A450Y941_9GAMM|nr:MAG: hypothetical protein BECKTC1821D_GA0114238_100337 [Candidatus Kentron sp. TC]VFK38984.1 MAG: hypothetical protein BECKTC1821E_GA0114239_100368 [Candidatus Kentron sp. TC]VFK54613.1 MAG: hypothetical protein BECKTC1821F_GA0114240_100566 [Candidatus Kentron sp. TC]